VAVNVGILGTARGGASPSPSPGARAAPGRALPSPSPRGLSESEGIEHVKESIQQILGTPIGSRVMRRDFGSRLHQIVFAPNDSTIDTLVEHYVREAIERWEKRVVIGPVTVVHSERHVGRVEIGIQFRIIRTNVAGNLVFPFYLQGAEGVREVER
jgi:phage baseplate assembly protein W